MKPSVPDTALPPVLPVDPGELPVIPFQRDIFLFETTVAGTSHIENIEKIADKLSEKQEVLFLREPDNPHDSRAILVKTLGGQKIGYIPKMDNLIFARLMDAGKDLFGKIKGIARKGKWVKISLEIYLRD